jgi:sugar lactone lactonase YvrE
MSATTKINTPIEIPSAAVLPVQMADALTGESPFWDARDATLWWIDIQGQKLLGFRPISGERLTYHLPSMPGFIAGRLSGGLLIGLEGGIHHFDPVGGLQERLVAVEADLPGNRLNDGKPDVHGRLWFGSMDKSGSGAPSGSLYRIDEVLSVHCERKDVRIPNAIAFSPDGASMYFADSRTGVIEVMDYDPRTGLPGEARTLAAYGDGEAPDGVCVDQDGGIWIAVVGGSRIERRSPHGELDLVVRLPVSRPTMPMLGGVDGRTLYITSQRRFLSIAALRSEPLAGQLLAVRVAYRASEAAFARI